MTCAAIRREGRHLIGKPSREIVKATHFLMPCGGGERREMLRAGAASAADRNASAQTLMSALKWPSGIGALGELAANVAISRAKMITLAGAATAGRDAEAAKPASSDFMRPEARAPLIEVKSF